MNAAEALAQHMRKVYRQGVSDAVKHILGDVGKCQCYDDMPNYTSPNCVRHSVIPKGQAVDEFVSEIIESTGKVRGKSE